jgi:transcription elongation factor/antiterminator RfaH
MWGLDVASDATLAASDLVARWYVVQSTPHREFTAERQLAAQDFRTFLPLFLKGIRHARRIRTAPAPLFPGYLFVELMIGRDRWRSVNGTFGVSRMVMAGDRPKPVPIGVVERLLGNTDRRGVLSFQNELKTGQAVHIMSGPLTGQIGTLIEMTSAKRVQVLLEIMGGPIAVSIATETLLPAA